MKNTQKKTYHAEVVVSMTCDVCKKNYTDDLDTQEFLCIDSVGGYSSAIGDEIHYRCDICSKCTEELLGKYLIKD